MQGFRVPRDIFFGEGALEYLKSLKGKRGILVTGGSSMKRCGFLEQAAEYLQEAGMETTTFEGVEPNPSVETVNRGARVMRDFSPDWVVAVGGGSAIDAAKAMWIFYEYPDLTFENILSPDSIPPLRQKSKFAAVPSTSGTASEVTAFSVITDTETHIKYPIVSYEMTPDVAILDPLVPAKMPPHVTAHTGMDALTHAVEAYVSTAASAYTDSVAVKAIKLVFDYIYAAYTNGHDIDARENMHNASTLAGMAFTNASLGCVHSMAHNLGGQFGTPHGLANAVLLPYLIEYNYSASSKFKEIEKELGINSLADSVRELNNKLNIPFNLKECEGIKEDTFKKVLSEMSKNAFNDPCTLTNPRKIGAEDIAKLYEVAYAGGSVVF
ncbi:MAG: iron-containing alcohol dehydrogenase [Clostridiales bacterium]|nr:iron-containing alcohol dehydrogenase [Clostridiales bacterium]MCF8021476.1 iron-containing alcohol dehydrogenase [Clostridiales bacterium]